MKYIILLFLINFSVPAMNVQKQDVEKMLEQMVANGIMSKEEALEAKRKLDSMPQSQWNEINEKGRSIASKHENPNVDLSVDSAAKSIDFESDEFKNIQNSLKKTFTNP